MTALKKAMEAAASHHHARVDTIAQHVFSQDLVFVCSAGGMSMVRERFAISQKLWKVNVCVLAHYEERY